MTSKDKLILIKNVLTDKHRKSLLLISKDLIELKRVYPDIQNSTYKELIQMNKNMYPEMRK